ncbi:peptide deformylase [Sulfitobacter sp. TBRI5]|uniref:peptide deformylase n=1 Tax=Sulfitobacter sp. TBRI5 TaxID=2989732 RepID=UPI003D9BBADF
MAVLPILKWPDAILAQICAPVRDVAAVQDLARDMLDTMYAAPGRGLAAPQVGQLHRMFVMDAGWKDGKPDPLVMINPVILELGEETAINTEGCLSLPGITAEVQRPATVLVQWITPEGARAVQGFQGFAAVCVQHEMDHLDGIVTLDHLDSETPTSLEAAYQAQQ